MGQFNNKIMAEFNPPRKWTLGRDLSYTTSELTIDEIKALKGVGVKIKRETIAPFHGTKTAPLSRVRCDHDHCSCSLDFDAVSVALDP